MKPKRILLLALLSGFITTILFYLMMNAEVSEAQKPEQEEMIQVAAAASDMEKDQLITGEHVIFKEIPIGQLHAEMIEDIDQAVQQYTVAEIKQGEILMKHRMQHKEDESAVASRKINDGNRATSIEVNYVTGISNLIQPEDFVDVFLITEDDDQIVTEIILEKVRVLAIGEQITELKEDGTEEHYQAVTLELAPIESLEVIHGNTWGKLHLSLYSKSDIANDNAEMNKDEKTDAIDIVTVPAKSIIRNGPSLEATPLEIVGKEMNLTLLNEQETDDDGRIWLKVEISNKETGWISSRILKNATE